MEGGSTGRLRWTSVRGSLKQRSKPVELTALTFHTYQAATRLLTMSVNSGITCCASRPQPPRGGCFAFWGAMHICYVGALERIGLDVLDHDLERCP